MEPSRKRMRKSMSTEAKVLRKLTFHDKTLEPSRKNTRMTLRSDSRAPSSQPLLKLPYLVQTEIIKSMTPAEQYLLSKCSRRTRRAIKNTYSDKKSQEIWVHFQRKPVVIQGKYNMLFLYFYLKIGGNKMLIHESLSEFSPEEHEGICDLFKAPLEIYACFEKPGPWTEDFIFNRTIKRSNLLEWTNDSEAIQEYSERHPNQDLVLFNGVHTHLLIEGHSFFGAQNLMISRSNWYDLFSVLSRFEGEHLLMKDVRINTYLIELFVDKWMKDKNDRLKSVIVQYHPGSVTNDLKFEKFSGRDKQYQYDSPIEEYHQFPDGAFNCSDGYDVKRETDGKSATITIIKNHFMFFVW